MEEGYMERTSLQHRKKYGQYFTDPAIAEFMCTWACRHARTMLDPAAGNSIFLSCARKNFPRCTLTGFEIDKAMLDYFGNPAKAELKNENYLLSGWGRTYDAIVCNPPYHRFQDIPDRKKIIADICAHTGIRCSLYTNLYLLFLIKSISELSESGRLAYLLPSEFLNSGYGTAVKQLLIERRLLRAIINFEDDRGLFENAATTCCILLLDRAPKSEAAFFSIRSAEELQNCRLSQDGSSAVRIPYSRLKADEKWRVFLTQENCGSQSNLVPLSRFCRVTRGIATGANDYFCFSLSKARALGIPEHCLTKCVCRSADIRRPVFEASDFESLAAADRTVFLLNDADPEAAASYLALGKENGIDRKYLPSHRNPWYAPEQKKAAPIWVASACRNGMKFVRNAANVLSLTTFHSVYVHPSHADDTDLIFCYFLTPAAQEILRENRKVLGNGLEKFQPGDLNTAKMLDLELLTPEDREKVLRIYCALKKQPDAQLISQLNHLFSEYMKP